MQEYYVDPLSTDHLCNILSVGPVGGRTSLTRGRQCDDRDGRRGPRDCCGTQKRGFADILCISLCRRLVSLRLVCEFPRVRRRWRPCFPTPIIIRPSVKISITVVTSLQRLIVSSAVKTESMTTPVPLTVNLLVSSSSTRPKLSGDRRASTESIAPVTDSSRLLRTRRFPWPTPRRCSNLTLPNWLDPQTNSSLWLPFGHLLVHHYKCPQPLIFRYYILTRRFSVQWRT